MKGSLLLRSRSVLRSVWAVAVPACLSVIMLATLSGCPEAADPVTDMTRSDEEVLEATETADIDPGDKPGVAGAVGDAVPDGMDRPEPGRAVSTDRDERVAIELEGMNVQVTRDDEGFITAISTESAGGFGDGEVELLTGLPRLSNVSLFNSLVSGEGLKTVAGIDTIRRLNLRRTSNIGPDDLAVLTELPNLEVLELLYNSNSVTDEALDHVAKLTKLRSLDLRGCSQVSDAGLLKLGTLKNLEDLKLRCVALTDKGMTVLGEMPKLKYLEVQDSNAMKCETFDVLADNDGFVALTFFNLDLDDEDLAPFAGSNRLKKANFRGTALFGDGLDYFGESTQTLRILNLSESIFGDDNVGNVAQFVNLEDLDLWQTDISDEGLKGLTVLENLKRLVLKQDRDVTNAGLETLATMKSLETLDLEETSIDDDGIMVLKDLPNLKRLIVAQTSVTEEGAAALKKELPDLTIEF